MVNYTTSPQDVAPDQLSGFFVGWANGPSPETHLDVLGGSSHVVLARDPNGLVVGFVTAVSDGYMNAHIPLLEVRPEFQRRGIGSELMTRMLDLLRDYYAIDTVCDPGLVPFYRRFGFREGKGMMIRQTS